MTVSVTPEGEKCYVLEVPGHPGVLKNSKRVLKITEKGCRREKCRECGQWKNQKTILAMSERAKEAKERAVKDLYAQWFHKKITCKVMVKMEGDGN